MHRHSISDWARITAANNLFDLPSITGDDIYLASSQSQRSIAWHPTLLVCSPTTQVIWLSESIYFIPHRIHHYPCFIKNTTTDWLWCDVDERVKRRRRRRVTYPFVTVVSSIRSHHHRRHRQTVLIPKSRSSREWYSVSRVCLHPIRSVPTDWQRCGAVPDVVARVTYIFEQQSGALVAKEWAAASHIQSRDFLYRQRYPIASGRSCPRTKELGSEMIALWPNN